MNGGILRPRHPSASRQRLWLAAMVALCAGGLGSGCKSFSTTPSPFEVAKGGPFPFDVGVPVEEGEAREWPPLNLSPTVADQLARRSSTEPAESFELIQTALATAEELESMADASCVDYYYLAAAAAWPMIGGEQPAGSPPLAAGEGIPAIGLYHAALAGCLETGQRFGRLDARRRLLINTPRGLLIVPVTHCGFVWRSHDFDYVALVRPYECSDLTNHHAREGLGAPLVVFRRQHVDEPSPPEATFLVDMQPFAATAVLHADLAPFLSAASLAQSDDSSPASASGQSARLELLDPLRVSTAAAPRGLAPLAADWSAPLAVRAENPLRFEFEVLGFVRPGKLEGGARLTMLEPYRPGAMPLVLIHGLLSSPLTWADMVNELQLDPEVIGNYQIWAFRYATGDPFLRSAAELRAALRTALATVDPQCRDAALNETVLAGHSMGGLLSRLQVTNSEDRLWRLWAKKPLESLHVHEDLRTALRDVFFFEPQPFVSRVIFLGAPHHGSNWATSSVGNFGSALVSQPDATTAALARMVDDNPQAFPGRHRRLSPTSIDMLAPDNPFLLEIERLPRSPRVRMHTIMGNSPLLPLLPPGDGVVPVASARTPGVESELIVPARHTHVHRHPLAIAEVRRILRDHSLGRGRAMVSPRAD